MPVRIMRPASCFAFAALLGLATGCGQSAPETAPILSLGEEARAQVEATERAFAKTMADRDLEAFKSFLASETVFFSGPAPLHGADAVSEYWQRFFSDPDAPFSWEPDQVEVLASGTLALSTGPVYDPQGKLVSRFSSIWRQESPGQWRIVFDRGEPAPATTTQP
jgi:ketosteroid isomerase-like protein